MAVDTPYAPLRRAGDGERRVVVAVLTEAFTHDPLVQWLFPEEGERGRLLAHFYLSLLDHPAGEAYLAGRDEGAAVWLTLTEGQPPHEDAPESGSVLGEGGARLRALGAVLGDRHPTHEPHLYLPCMGVVSGRQGSGLGSAMLRHRLAMADAQGLPVHLEASSPRSRALYLRHGFADLGDPVRVGDGPPLWPMRRRIQPVAADPASGGRSGQWRQIRPVAADPAQR